MLLVSLEDSDLLQLLEAISDDFSRGRRMVSSHDSVALSSTVKLLQNTDSGVRSHIKFSRKGGCFIMSIKGKENESLKKQEENYLPVLV